MEIKNSGDTRFLSGGGEMGELTRSKDWSKTSVGEINQWPQSLRTTLSIILNSRFPMFLWWGPELICFYNDAYRPSLGQHGKHPSILGKKAEDAWAEIWTIIKPLIDQVLAGGESIWSEDQLIPIYRNEKLEDVYWTFSYSPVYNELNKIEGVLVTCNETTEKVITLKKLEESKDELKFAIEATHLGTFDYTPATNKFGSNDRLKEWFGLPLKAEIELQQAIDVITEEDKEKVKEAIEKALTYSSGGRYDIIYTIVHPVTKKQTTVHAKGKAWFNEQKIAYRFNGTLEDITTEIISFKKIEESEKRFRNVANSAPVLIWMAGTDKLYNFFNSAWLAFTGHTMEEEKENGWKERVHPEDFKKCIDIYTYSFDKREPFYMEYRFKRYDGEYRWVSDNGTPRFSADNIFEGYIGACLDIHERVIYRDQLIQNEEKLKIIIEASELGTWELDLINYKPTYSQRYLEIIGGYKDHVKLTHDQLLSRIHPDDLQMREKAFKDSLKTGQLHYESRLIWQDKSIHWVETKGKVFYDEKNKPEKLIGTLRDITNEKYYQQELKESEQKFRLLADSMPQFIWTGNREGDLNYFNRSVYEYSGLTQQQMNTVGWIQIVHPDDRDENIKQWISSVKTGKDFLFEHRFRRYDGEYRWQLSRAVPQKDAEGNIQMWVGTSTDIQDQKVFASNLEKQVQERTIELKKSEERYHLMVEEVQDYAILYLNREGIVENWNKGAEKIKGYRSDEIIGKNFSVFYTEKDRIENLPNKLLLQATTVGKAVQEGWRVRKDKSLFWASVVITAVHNETKDVIGFSKVTHDLTEKKEADNKLKANAEQLRQKNIDLEKMNKELQSFAYVSSHDLQEPLRKIQTFATRILEKESQNLSETGKDYFSRMQDAAARMQQLIEDLLSYSRTNTTERKYEETDLQKIIEEVKDDLKEELKLKNAIVDVKIIGNTGIIPFQFRQLMTNLIGNSLKFSIPGKEPRIIIKSEMIKGNKLNLNSVNIEKMYFHISVSDNGIGFEPEYNEKIFEVFQRLHRRDVYAGTGIGLAIVKKIVENHNGIITATGEINKGATFDIYIPS